MKFPKRESFSFEQKDLFEYVSVDVHLNDRKTVSVMCMYRTPGTSIDIFNQHIENVLKETKNKIAYIYGDFNINLIKYDEHVHTQQFLDLLLRYGFIPTIPRPIPITEFSATLIDNIYTNEVIHTITSGLLIKDISDHLPVFTHCEYALTRNESTTYKYVRKCDEKSLDLFRNELLNQKINKGK